MRKVIFYTWDENRTEDVIRGWIEIDALRAKYPDMFPRGLHSDNNDLGYHESPPWGFGIYDGTEEQFNNWKAHYEKYGLIVVPHPDLGGLWAKPIYHATDYVSEYLHMKNIEGVVKPTHKQVCERLQQRANVKDDLESRRRDAIDRLRSQKTT